MKYILTNLIVEDNKLEFQDIAMNPISKKYILDRIVTCIDEHKRFHSFDVSNIDKIRKGDNSKGVILKVISKENSVNENKKRIKIALLKSMNKK